MFIRELVDGLPSGNVIVSDNIPDGFAQWFPSEKPRNPAPNLEFVEGVPEDNGNGAFHQTWVLQDKVFETQEEEDAATESQWGVVRQIRNDLLQRTDWYALSDSQDMPTEIAEYRQALRDITTQADPYNITWPTKPSELA